MRGSLMMLGAGLFYTLNDAILKLAVAHLSFGEVIFIRGSVSCLLLLIIALFGGLTSQLRWKDVRGQILCAIFYIAGAGFLVISLRHLSFPVAITAFYTSPLFAALLAPYILNEPIKGMRIAAALVGFVGVALVARPDSSGFSWFILLALAAGLANTLRDITVGRVVRSDGSFSILVFSQISLTVSASVFAVFDWQPVPFASLGLLITAGVAATVAVFFSIEAFRSSDVAGIAALRYAAIVWAAIVGATIWHDQFTITQLCGMLLVIGSGTLVVIAERRINPAISSV